jgi:hypothetical protein
MAGIAWVTLWVLVVAGALLALAAPVLALGPLRRLLGRPETLARAQLFLDLDQLRERNAELARIPARIAPLIERSKRAQRSLEVGIRTFRGVFRRA